MLGIMALSLLWVTGAKILGGGFRWSLVSPALGMLLALAAFFLVVALFDRWMERRP
ncbi:hypothetical protein D3C87_2147900 [compost metagenome]